MTPPSVFDYDVATGKSTLLKQQEVLGGYDPKLYASERVWATARDGVKVPVSIVYKKGFPRDGKGPLLLYAYGSYGIGTPVTFSSARLSLLDRGVAYAIAHIRGGNEMGEKWREDGMLMKKKNTFSDFVDCAEYLIHEKWTSPDRLVIEGGSAGGLLMGAVVNIRPDLFRAVHAAVPFVDVINTMLDASLPLTVGEYLEWGNPNEKAAFDYMKTYSPYDNLEKRAYPAMLVTDESQRQPGDVLGARQVCGAAAHTQDGPESAAAENQNGSGGSRRRVGPLRPHARPGLRIRLDVEPGRNR